MLDPEALRAEMMRMVVEAFHVPAALVKPDNRNVTPSLILAQLRRNGIAVDGK